MLLNDISFVSEKPEFDLSETQNNNFGALKHFNIF